jgi:hypothetical protein
MKPTGINHGASSTDLSTVVAESPVIQEQSALALRVCENGAATITHIRLTAEIRLHYPYIER